MGLFQRIALQACNMVAWERQTEVGTHQCCFGSTLLTTNCHVEGGAVSGTCVWQNWRRGRLQPEKMSKSPSCHVGTQST